MSVTYTKQQRDVVKADKTRTLATVAIDGVSLQGPVTKEEASLIRKCFLGIVELRKAKP